MQRTVYILLGPPGSGKGTQAKRVAPCLKVPHISLGDLLREAVAKKTEIGLKIESFLKAGKLAPDEIVIKVAEDRIKQDDCREGVVVDGFPRTIAQAKAFEKILNKAGFNQGKVIYIDLPLEGIVQRLGGRRSCKKCGAVYHAEFSPPKAEGKCDKCGEELYLRHDDEKSVIETRFRVYDEQTKPLVDHYEKQGILMHIDGKQKIDNVFESICAKLKVA
ncbi:adenylate kinase [Candidatus Margulisiibacteriota bacterium]